MFRKKQIPDSKLYMIIKPNGKVMTGLFTKEDLDEFVKLRRTRRNEDTEYERCMILKHNGEIETILLTETEIQVHELLGRIRILNLTDKGAICDTDAETKTVQKQ